MKRDWSISAGSVVGILALVTALNSVWNDDAIAYSFFIPRVNEDASFAPITGIADICHSQINHYFNSNGRFVVHFFVQLFCGLWGKIAFALCNSLVWMLLVYNLSTLPEVLLKSRANSFSYWNRKSIYWLSAFLSILVLWYLPFTPPFQINYVWVSLLLVLWLRWFFNKNSAGLLKLILLALFSFIAGQLHEGFSIPTGGAIIVYFIAKRCRFTPRQWVMAIFFGIGALSTILAPGNYYRMNVMEGGRETGILNILSQFPNLLIFPLIYFVTVYPFKKKLEFKEQTFGIFFISFILISLLFNLYLKSFDRGLIPYNLAFSILIILYAAHHKIKRWEMIALAFIAAGIFGWRIYMTGIQNEKTEAILKEYTASETGRIYIPDNLFLFNLEETCQRRNTYTNLLRSQKGADKPFLVIYPESLKDVDLDKDTNMVIPFGDQSWICVQSASRPADFIVEKTLLPGVLNKKMSNRVLDFTSGSDIFIDSTANARTVVYTNTRPYIKAAIRQAAAQTEE